MNCSPWNWWASLKDWHSVFDACIFLKPSNMALFPLENLRVFIFLDSKRAKTCTNFSIQVPGLWTLWHVKIIKSFHVPHVSHRGRHHSWMLGKIFTRSPHNEHRHWVQTLEVLEVAEFFGAAFIFKECWKTACWFVPPWKILLVCVVLRGSLKIITSEWSRTLLASQFRRYHVHGTLWTNLKRFLIPHSPWAHCDPLCLSYFQVKVADERFRCKYVPFIQWPQTTYLLKLHNRSRRKDKRVPGKKSSYMGNSGTITNQVKPVKHSKVRTTMVQCSMHPNPLLWLVLKHSWRSSSQPPANDLRHGELLGTSAMT